MYCANLCKVTLLVKVQIYFIGLIHSVTSPSVPPPPPPQPPAVQVLLFSQKNSQKSASGNTMTITPPLSVCLSLSPSATESRLLLLLQTSVYFTSVIVCHYCWNMQRCVCTNTLYLLYEWMVLCVIIVSVCFRCSLLFVWKTYKPTYWVYYLLTLILVFFPVSSGVAWERG